MIGLKVKIVNAINVKEVEVDGIKFGKDGSRYYYREKGKKHDIWNEDMEDYEEIAKMLKKGKEEILKLWRFCVKVMREGRLKRVMAAKPFMKGIITIRRDSDGWTAEVQADFHTCIIDLDKFEEEYHKKLEKYEELARIGKLFKVAKKHLGMHSIE